MADRSKSVVRSRGIIGVICAMALAGGVATSATGAGGELFSDELPEDATLAPGVSFGSDLAGTEDGLSSRLAALARDRLASKSDDAQADALAGAFDDARDVGDDKGIDPF